LVGWQLCQHATISEKLERTRFHTQLFQIEQGHIVNVVDINIKQVRDGLVYLPNETKLFTGVFVDSYFNGQKRSEINQE